MIRFVVYFLTAGAVWGQTGVGQIQGTVRDASGAAIPRADVRAEHVQTHNTFQTIASDVGFFVFPSLGAGEYRLSISANGFQKWEGEITLRVGQQAELSPTLNVSGVTEQVFVLGDISPLVTTTNPTLATTVERERIEQLPLNGRAITALMQLTVPGLDGGTSATQPKVYGLRDSTMEFTQDGVVLDDRNTGNIQQRPPGLDTVQEYRIETSVSSAKLDRPASAIFSTRSGTNQFHGSLFYTGRNSAFGVARQRQDTFTKPPPLARSEYGASLGGPAIKNRTFFFASFEGYNLRQASSTGSAVWTEAMRRGDFSGLVDANGRKITLYDPWSVGPGPTYLKTAYPNNQLPLTKESPLAKYVFSVTPLPTAPGVNPLVAQNYFGLAPLSIDQRTLTFRGDHRIGEKDTIFGRYSHGLNDQFNRRAFNTGGNPITTDDLWNRETYFEQSNTAAVSWTHIFSPGLFVETVGTLSLIDWQYSLNQPSAQQNISAQLGTPNPFNVNGAPALLNLGYTGGGIQAISYAGVVPRREYTKLGSIEQNYTWVVRRHQIEFGGRFRQEYLDTVPDRPDPSDISFSSNATALYNPATGNAFGNMPQTGDNGANFFLGIANSYAQSRPPGFYNAHGKDISGYIQDNWKIRRDLTINLGLRWQYLGPYLDDNGVTSVWDFGTKSLVRTASLAQLVRTGYTTQPIADAYTALGVKYTTPSQVELPDSLIHTNKHDFGPRAGFAYNTHLGGKTLVVRGGYGMYHFPIPARSWGELRLNPPLQGSYSFDWNSSTQSPDGLPNYFLRAAPTVIAGVNSENVLDISKPPTVLPGVQVTGLDSNFPTSVAHEWNFTLESEVMKDTLVRASLIGTAGRHNDMMQLYNYNPISNYVWYVTSGQPLPTGYYSNTVRRDLDQTTYGNMRIFSKIGYSNYTGIQLEMQRRFSRGIAFQVFYLLSNSASTGSTPAQGGDPAQNGIYQPNIFLPGQMPQNVDDRIRFYRYARDTDIPQHRIRYNFLYDLPFGRGKKVLGKSGPWLDRLVGGFQIAGSGTFNSRWWSLPTGNWGYFGTPQVYGTQYPVQDCRSGACFPGFLYYNGYIPANRINVPGGVLGVPANYAPSSKPINPAPATGTVDPNFNDTNNVYVTLKNGTQQLVNYDNGLNPWRNQAMHGPWINSMNASLFKNVPITERVVLRINLDAFNVFNQPGMNLPDPNTGILSMRTSAQGARVLQYTARLSW